MVGMAIIITSAAGVTVRLAPSLAVQAARWPVTPLVAEFLAPSLVALVAP